MVGPRDGRFPVTPAPEDHGPSPDQRGPDGHALGAAAAHLARRVLGMTCALASWLVARTAPLRGLEDWALDYCFACRGTRTSPARDRIVIVGLDEAALDALGKPMALASPELGEVVTYLEQPRRDGHRPGRLRDPGDARRGPRAPAPAPWWAWPLTEAAANVVLPAVDGRRPPDPAPAAPGRSAGGAGLVELTEDDDHFVRRQQLAIGVGGRSYDCSSPWRCMAVAGRGEVDDADGLRVGGRPCRWTARAVSGSTSSARRARSRGPAVRSRPGQRPGADQRGRPADLDRGRRSSSA